MVEIQTAFAAADQVHDYIIQWFDAYQSLIFRHVFRIVGDREQAADLVQETYIRALKSLDPVAIPNVPLAWLYRIASNLALDALRRKRRWAWFVSKWKPEQETADIADGMVITTAVRHCLAQLSAEDAEVIILVHFADLKVEDAAKIIGQGVAATRTRLQRARQRFRQLYQKEYER